MKKTKYLRQDEREIILARWANLPDPDTSISSFTKEVKALLRGNPLIFAELQGMSEQELMGLTFGIREHLHAAWNHRSEDVRKWYAFKLRDLYASTVRRKNSASVVNAMGRITFKHGFEKEHPEIARALLQADEFSLAHPALARAGRQLALKFERFGWIVHPPRDSAFDKLMQFFDVAASRALRCEWEECPHPYFFKPEGRKNQRYCSAECSKKGRNKGKREYWRKNYGSKKTW